MPPDKYFWANVPPPANRPKRKEPVRPRGPQEPQTGYTQQNYRECMPNQPNYPQNNQQGYPQNYQQQPMQQPQQQQPQPQGCVDESNLPLHLRRGAQYQRNAPRVPQTPQQQIPDNMQRRYAEIEQHYYDNPQTTEPAPKQRRINLNAAALAVFVGLSVLGIIGAIMNFVYSRGNANLATSVSFLHAEIAVLFIVMIVMGIIQYFKR